MTRSRNARSWLATRTGPSWPVTKSAIRARPRASRLLVGSSSSSTSYLLSRIATSAARAVCPPDSDAERPVRRDVEPDLGRDLGQPVLEVGRAEVQPVLERVGVRVVGVGPLLGQRLGRGVQGAVGRRRRRYAAGRRPAATRRGRARPAAASRWSRRRGRGGRCPTRPAARRPGCASGVDLPEPFGPTRAVTSPSETTRSRPVTRVRAPYATPSPVRVRVVDNESSRDDEDRPHGRWEGGSSGEVHERNGSGSATGRHNPFP